MLASQEELFYQNDHVTFLNAAYMSPQLRSVDAAGIEAVQRKRKPHLIKPNHFFEESEQLRSEFAGLINSQEARRCVFIPSVSYGIATVTHNLEVRAGQNIVLAGEQFPSNVYSWKRLEDTYRITLNLIPPPDTLIERGKHWNTRILEAITEDTVAVSLGNIHWADGTLFDLKAIRQRTHEVGAALIIDGTQSVGALPFDVASIEPDALICGGYKWLMGPYSLGYAYFGPRFDDGIPIEENWINRFESENFANLVNYSDHYQPFALRYDVGEHSNFNLVPMGIEALRQVRTWTPEAIQEYCKTITQPSIQRLREAGFWIEDITSRACHLFGIRLPDHISMDTVKQRLEEEQIIVSIRGNAIRVSPHVYNTARDIEHLEHLILDLA
ncbi:MAG: aminotransferase class V-fold PLP-dependent enzyme [Bacteroidota bacterium]